MSMEEAHATFSPLSAGQLAASERVDHRLLGAAPPFSPLSAGQLAASAVPLQLEGHRGTPFSPLSAGQLAASCRCRYTLTTRQRTFSPLSAGQLAASAGDGHRRPPVQAPFSPLSAGQLAASVTLCWLGSGTKNFQSPIRGAIGCIRPSTQLTSSTSPVLSVPYPRGNWLHPPNRGRSRISISAFSPLSAGQLAASKAEHGGADQPGPLSVPYPRGNWLHLFIRRRLYSTTRPGFQSPIRGAIGCIPPVPGSWSRHRTRFQSPIRGAIGCIDEQGRPRTLDLAVLSVPYPRGNWLHRERPVLVNVRHVWTFSPLSAGQLAASALVRATSGMRPHTFSPLSAGQLAASSQRACAPVRGRGGFQSPIRGAIGCIPAGGG